MIETLDIPLAEDLLWRLEVIENRLRAVGKVDLCDEFSANTREVVWEICVWYGTYADRLFWQGLEDMLWHSETGGHPPDIDRVIAARKAVTKYLKEAGYEV